MKNTITFLALSTLILLSACSHIKVVAFDDDYQQAANEYCNRASNAAGYG
jgi:hypothetical protein